MKFGDFTTSLATRSRLSQKQITLFVGWNYFRRLMQAIIILGLYAYPVMQVVLSLKLNLIDLAIIVLFRPYASSMEQRSETLNGIASLLILYCLMLFSDQFISEKKQVSNIGDFLISIQVINIAVNVLPMLALLLMRLYRGIKQKKYKQCLRYLAKKKDQQT